MKNIVCLFYYSLLIGRILKRSFKPYRSDVESIVKTDFVSVFDNLGIFARCQNLHQNIIRHFRGTDGFVRKNQHG